MSAYAGTVAARVTGPARAAVSDRIRGSVLVGAVAILVLFAGAGGWAAWAPLDSAIVAPGQFVVEYNRKNLKHPDGGVVSDLLVREGQRVSAGDVLLRFDSTELKATVSFLATRRVALAAMEARLLSEREARDAVAFPAALLERARTDDDAASAIDLQRGAFESRRMALQHNLSVLDQQMTQLREVAAGARTRIQSGALQRRLIAQELEGTRELFEKGYAPKTRVLALERAMAQLDGTIGDAQATAARTVAAIDESRDKKNQLRSERAADLVRQLEDVQSRLAEVREREVSARHRLEATALTTPVGGRVIGLRVHAVGAVIRPGEEILDIVPENEQLVVEARVKPSDIDAVRPGAEARVRLSAYPYRKVPDVSGTIFEVSADRLSDESNGTSFFVVSVRLDPSGLPEGSDVAVHPGMPAEVMVRTGERSALDYLLGPLFSSFDTAMREE